MSCKKSQIQNYHCKVLSTYDLLNWVNMIKCSDILLSHGLATSLLGEMMKQNQNSSTRATARGDYKIPHGYWTVKHGVIIWGNGDVIVLVSVWASVL